MPASPTEEPAEAETPNAAGPRLVRSVSRPARLRGLRRTSLGGGTVRDHDENRCPRSPFDIQDILDDSARESIGDLERRMDMVQLVYLEGDLAGNSLEAKTGPSVIGRGDVCHVVVVDPSVSSTHCLLTVTELSVTVRDLGSTNGTFVAGERIDEAEIADGQVLRLGSVPLRIMIPPAKIAIPKLSREEPPAPKVLEDGAPACEHHPEIAATHGCEGCGRTYCAACVHDVHLAGHRPKLFCPACSSRCLPFEPEIVEAAKPTVTGGLLDTIRLGLSWRRSARRRAR